MFELVALTLLSMLTGFLVITIAPKNWIPQGTSPRLHIFAAMMVFWVAIALPALTTLALAAPTPWLIYKGAALYWTAIYLLMSRWKT